MNLRGCERSVGPTLHSWAVMAPCLAPLWILIDEYFGFFGMKKVYLITCDLLCPGEITLLPVYQNTYRIT